MAAFLTVAAAAMALVFYISTPAHTAAVPTPIAGPAATSGAALLLSQAQAESRASLLSAFREQQAASASTAAASSAAQSEAAARTRAEQAASRAQRPTAAPTTTAAAPTSQAAAPTSPKPAPTSAKPAPVATTATGIKAYASAKVGDAAQFACLDKLWTRESGWNPAARNPTSTAYGIPQFLDSTWIGTGIGKTANAELQVSAGLVYIRAVYGSPCNAWAHSQSTGWY